MARLWHSGFELQSVTAGVEFDTITGSPTINTSIVRSGAASLRCNPTAATAYVQHDYADSTTIKFARVYVYIASAPSAITDILMLGDNANSYVARIRMNTNRTLELWSDSAQVGSDSSALDLDTWYRIELSYDDANADAVVARIDGTNFATGTGGNNGGNGRFRLGVCTAVTADLYFDDFAVNDSASGGSQTTFPGDGKIIHLRPNAAGDANAMTPVNGGTAGAANNFTRVDEITPDDITSYNQSNVTATGLTDDYNIDDTPVAIGASDTINVVSVGMRFAKNSSLTPNGSLTLRIKKTSGGTVSSSSVINATSTTYFTNAIAAPRVYRLTLYTDPDGASWTKSTLDSAQIGATGIAGAAGSQPRLSTEWLLVDWTPSAGGDTVSQSFRMMQGMGR